MRTNYHSEMKLNGLGSRTEKCEYWHACRCSDKGIINDFHNKEIWKYKCSLLFNTTLIKQCFCVVCSPNDYTLNILLLQMKALLV